MGVLRIDMGGSFPPATRLFGAEAHGHAHAVAQAIEWLAGEVLPAAIAQDHRLQDAGTMPRLGFERSPTLPGEHGRIATPTLQDPDATTHGRR